ncbi:lamin-like protein [Rhodamnia argentea]|uniref:Lamin-like protein n=1 Tax=Rhodamnia argentea TaxID=178133 RepID=A0A8B8N4C7_9MYRT|nr:lamin-like protein [Rhodamnia argentea]
MLRQKPKFTEEKAQTPMERLIMESFWRKLGLAVTLIVTVTLTTLAEPAGGELHKVGGRSGWIEHANYTEWSSRESFLVRDWLYFVFNKQMYDVLEVNETSYETCNSQGFISNVTRGGRDVFQLKEAKTYYFICSRGYCWGGMKLTVNVVVASPAPAPSPSRAAPLSVISSSLAILLLIVTGLLSLKPPEMFEGSGYLVI